MRCGADRLTPADPARARAAAPAISCSRWARWARSSSIIRATSISSCSSIPRRPRSRTTPKPSALYIRVTRGLVKLLQERTADGYVFRVDLRLRPDPASTQIAISVPAALDYYEHRGQNWERSAMIKARPCAGDIAAGEALLKALSPFVWRKYMDFAALADIHAMKRQIHAYRGHGEIAVAGHNIKLGRGGIREIEFFVQTQQLIAGGRHPELRDRAHADDALSARRRAVGRRAGAARAGGGLSVPAAGRAPAADGRGRADPHTAGRRRRASSSFARFLGFDSAAVLRGGAASLHLRNVQQHYSRLFEPVAQAPGARAAISAGRGRPRDARSSRRRWAFAIRWKSRRLVRGWLGGQLSRAAQRFRARAACAAGALSDRTSGAQRESRTGGRWPSTVSSPGCMPRAARG